MEQLGQHGRAERIKDKTDFRVSHIKEGEKAAGEERSGVEETEGGRRVEQRVKKRQGG